jgi:hypothetical protein
VVRHLIAAVAAAMISLIASSAAAAASPPFTQCPGVGFDSSCAVLFTVNPDGSITTSVDTTQPAFDGVEDTLVGVQNNTAVTTIPSLTLSGAGIFNFEGDGLCSGKDESGGPGFRPPPAGCPFGPTSYEGPNTSFSVVDGNNGTVNFTGGLAPGASTYFSLEEPPSVTGQVTVEQPIIVHSTTINATEGTSFSGVVATASDADPASTGSEYEATIEWGDGSSSVGTVSGTGGSFEVDGSHTYADEGSYPVKVTLTDIDTPANHDTATSTANVNDAALSASGVPATSAQAFNGVVANFSDANTSSTTEDFTATIDWGDGSSTSNGTVSGSGGSYSVSGSHTYAGTGYFTIKVHIVDDGGSTADATTKVLVFGTSAGGNFVIGDNNAGSGTAVTFWGAQWWKANSLSDGPAPASFKGFEDSPAVASCSQSWTTDPGNSTPPPAGPLPAYMEVIVSSAVSKSGSTIAGNTPHLVVVKTNGGYAPNPGHAGTGTVIAPIC